MNVDFKGLHVVIIGTGRYGTWWKQVFQAQECEVRMIGEGTSQQEKRECFLWATVILSATSLETSVEYLKKFGPFMNLKQLFVNTSSQQFVCSEVMTKLNAEYVGLHILSDVPEGLYLADETVVLCTTSRLKDFEKWVKKLLRCMHAKNIQRISSFDHDDLMLFETVFPRLLVFLLGGVLVSMHVDPQKLRLLETKFGRILYGALRRFLMQGNRIEGELLIENKSTITLIDQMICFLFWFRTAIVKKDSDSIIKLKQTVRDHFGEDFLKSSDTTEPQ